MLDEVNAAFEVADQRASEAAHALNEALSRENAAREREAEARASEQAAVERENEANVAEAPFKAAQEELEAALADLKAKEDAYNNKTEALKKQSEEGGVVTRNRAKVQLDAHLVEDPLPLRRAKLTLEAARKKAEKARAPFEAAVGARVWCGGVRVVV
jgi:F actin bundling C terminal